MLHRQGNAFCAARRASGVEALEPRRLLSGAIPSVPGDANLDGTVNFADLINLAQNYRRSGAAWAEGDFDGDGTVAFADLITLAQNYGKDTTTPYLARISLDPSSLVLASGTRFRFGATAYDQFGSAISPQPAFMWSVAAGNAGGTVGADGTYTATASTGSDTLKAASGIVSATASIAVTGSGIFTADNDIGAPPRAGHYSYNAGVYTVSGSGADIWNASDQFNFPSTTLSGNGILIARVNTLQNTDTWAKAGIMFRETQGSASRDVYLVTTPHDQVQFLDRATSGAAAVDSGDASSVPFPVWLKLIRNGSQFTGFWSSNGSAWNQLGGAVSVGMGSTVAVGLVTSSHSTATLTTATFDNVSVTAQPSTGVYRLTTRAQPGLALDVASFANADGTPIQLYNANHTSNQQWLVESQGDGTYKIYAYSGKNSLQMLDDNNGNTANLNPVTTWEDNNTSAQRWVFVPVSGGYWRIVPQNAAGSLQTLEILGGNAAGAGARTDIYGYWGGDNQIFHLDDPGVPAILPSPKKGLAGWTGQIGNINPSWLYTWGGDEPSGLPPGVEFVPMEWGYYGNANNSSVNWLNYVKSQPGVREILGYNEPDSTTQANLSVAAALDGWQYLNQLGIPLGSPAAVHADDQWMRDFMAGAAQRGYRVDFVTIHWYGGDDPAGFLGYVDYIHNLYNKPVWITEFAPADWSGNHGISPQQAADFMRQVIPALNQRSYVQRYSWFSANTTDAALGQSALFNPDGSLTDLGKLYSRM